MAIWRNRAHTWPAGRTLTAGLIAATCGALVFGAAASSIGETGPSNDGTVRVVGDGKLLESRPKLQPAREALSSEEVSFAYSIALTAPEIPQDASDVHGNPGPQLIHADLPPLAQANGGERLAQVMLHDYTGNRGYTVSVSLTKSRVTSVSSARNSQPPPVADEADQAMEIALTTSPPAEFVQQFEEANGIPLLSREQVWYRAGAWVYDRNSGVGQACQKHRCVQLIVRDLSGHFFDTTGYVIDLTTREIVPLTSGATS